MADQPDATSADVDTSATEDDDAAAQDLLADAIESDESGDDDKPLGPKGEKAYQAEKDKRRAAQAELREWRKLGLKPEDIAKLLAEKDSGADAPDPAKVRDQAKAEATAELMRERVLDKIEAKAAKGFVDPEDAAALVLRGRDPDDFLDDGKVDVEAIQEALAELLEKKPYLAAQGGKKFQGTADGGARNGKTKPSQLNREDVKRLAAEGKHQEIEKARSDGRLDDLLAGK